MKNIMVLVHDDKGQESRLQCAFDVVRAVDGHLTCLDVVVPPVVTGDFVEAYAQGVLIKDAVETEQENRARLEPRLRVEGVPYTWTEAMGFIPDCIIEHAGLNDLIVVGAHPDKGDPHRGDVAGDIVRRARRPVLAVPHELRRFDIFGTAMIAWDGSDSADAALRTAMPLLQKAEATVIVTVGSSACDPTEAAEYCARHGVQANIRATPAIGSTSEMLRDRAGFLDASWIVMGAYGHSPLREAIFGGVTREMLEHATIPLFIAS